MESKWNDKILGVEKPGFTDLALEIFRFQYGNNPTYQQYVDALGVSVSLVKSMEGIPFLPIRFFKSHPIQTTLFSPEVNFESSGTTGSVNSHHLVKDVGLYKESFLKTFYHFYGPVEDWCILGLLPSYLEKTNSSLVFMIDELIKRSKHKESGFYLYEHKELFEVIKSLEQKGQETILWGVTFALLDFAEKFNLPLQHTVIMETGGMKGRREEMIRLEVHEILKKAFSVPSIHSEYGMTELLSQAYSIGDGIFRCPPWMKILVRDDDDPLTIKKAGGNHVTGAINVIDLANVYSCSFIATDDAGRLFSDESFAVLGRIDNSDIRGCSLLTV